MHRCATAGAWPTSCATIRALGGGRQKKGDPIDPRVGVMVHAKVGSHVAAGDPLCTIHAADASSAQWVVDRLQESYTLGAEPAARLPILLDRVADM